MVYRIRWCLASQRLFHWQRRRPSVRSNKVRWFSVTRYRVLPSRSGAGDEDEVEDAEMDELTALAQSSMTLEEEVQGIRAPSPQAWVDYLKRTPLTRKADIPKLLKRISRLTG